MGPGGDVFFFKMSEIFCSSCAAETCGLDVIRPGKHRVVHVRPRRSLNFYHFVKVVFVPSGSVFLENMCVLRCHTAE